jgi:hypothetical protein
MVLGSDDVAREFGYIGQVLSGFPSDIATWKGSIESIARQGSVSPIKQLRNTKKKAAV